MEALAISDIHLERRGPREGSVLSESFDLLICAGDICQNEPEKSAQSAVDLARGKRAIGCPGNRDFFARTISDEAHAQ
jgi:predicted phosphodiesterase